MTLPDSKQIWNKILYYLNERKINISGRNISLCIHHFVNDKRYRLYKYRDFLIRVADKCFYDDIRSYVKFKVIYDDQNNLLYKVFHL